MMIRRGLTLLEVLASLVLLAMLTAACVPLLQRAMRVLHDCQASDSRIDIQFTQLVDKAIAEPATFGITDWSFVDSITIAWPEDQAREPILVQVIKAIQPGQQPESEKLLLGNWLQFQSNGVRAYRWVGITRSESNERPGSGVSQ